MQLLERIWDKLERFIIYNVKLEDTIEFSDQNVIFNIVHPDPGHIIKYDGTYHQTIYM